MAWAKAECVRKKCDETNVRNLRLQLGPLFNEIHFGAMAMKDFQSRYQLYDGLFSLEEYRDITMMIGRHEVDDNGNARNREMGDSPEADEKCRKIICNFPPSRVGVNVARTNRIVIKFESDTRLYLRGISCGNFIGPAKVKIHKVNNVGLDGAMVHFDHIQSPLSTNSASRHRCVQIEFSKGIKIEPEVNDQLWVETTGIYTAEYYAHSYAKLHGIVEMENGTGIKFWERYPFFQSLHFVESSCCSVC